MRLLKGYRRMQVYAARMLKWRVALSPFSAFFFFCCCFIEPLLSCTPVFGEKAIESAIEKKKKKAELQMAPLLLFFFFTS